MNTSNCLHEVWSLRARQALVSIRRAALALLLACGLTPALATTPLADQPVFSTKAVPGNLALALSVEFPTAVSVAHIDTTYDVNKVYLGYFDPTKCYLYSYNATEKLRHFYPAGLGTNRTCIGGDDAKWSGNYLNWATMQTVDPFRWALTGGYRAVDTATETLLEKAWASGQGGTGNFPDRTSSNATTISNSTPFAWAAFRMRVQGLGNKLRFSATGNINNTPTVYDPGVAVNPATVYEVSVRVKVCDTSAAAGPLEPNCTAYPMGNYKPTGLLQQYSGSFRYSAFGYLNDDNLQRDGGVLRARQKFVGPTMPAPNSLPVSNPAGEWDSNTGVQAANPDAADASATAALFGVAVSNSGVINYLNKFGQITPGSYKTYDPVGELYYAAIRYFKNLGNVPEWTAVGSASPATKTTWVDGFPVITNWDDPIQYSCQRNFVLGIGDVNTHADKNVPGSSTPTVNEPAKPSAVTSDTSVNTVLATNKLGAMHGLGATLGTTNPYNGCCTNNSALMAGLAYDSNTKDIRPDNPGVPQTIGMQTVQTYWLDILEFQTYKANNQFYLAAKYGGFAVPNGFDPYNQSSDIPLGWWSTTGETVGSQARPDNYFVASNPSQMVTGLTRAFAKAAADLRAFTTSFATSLPQISLSGSVSYGAQYDASDWSGEVIASSVAYNTTTRQPVVSPVWSFSAKLTTQIAGSGWNTGRRIATWNTATAAGVPFRLTNISSSQQADLDTVYRTGGDAGDYLNYLRGDPTHEEASTASGSAKIYRTRTRPVGDIAGSKVKPVGPPAAVFSSAANPGYGSFRTTWASRPTMLYVGSNAGMLHGINGSITGSSGGTEVFAYVPGALYQGPTGTPLINGLQSRGDPDFTHKPLVDGPVGVYDIDFGRTQGGTGTNWRSLLVGALGKGGKSYYALDVTDPASMTTEAIVASRVLWEFSHADLGYTYGEPAAVKTKKYGWVLVFGSGYNNTDGQGYFFIVNPRTGALLEKVGTGAGSTSAQAGMAHVEAFIPDRTDYTADAVYAGDLLGNVWRLDLTAASGSYPAPVRLATLTNAANAALPVTTRPLIINHAAVKRRFVTVGTGRLLDTGDVGSTQAQGFFAIADGTGTAFSLDATTIPAPPGVPQQPAGITFPILRTNLQEQTDLTQPVTVNFTTQAGWWLDLGTAAGGLGWRVITDSSAFAGRVTFAAMLPNGDVCSPNGISRLFSVDVGSGQSQLLDTNGLTVAYTASSSNIIETRTYSVDGKAELFVSDDKGITRRVDTKARTSLGLRRLNWRELPLAD